MPVGKLYNLQISCQKDQIRILYNYYGSDLCQKVPNPDPHETAVGKHLCYSGVKILHNITVVRASKDSPHQIFHDGELLRVAGGVLQLRLLQIFGRLLRPTNQLISHSINQSVKSLAFHRKTLRIFLGLCELGGTVVLTVV